LSGLPARLGRDAIRLVTTKTPGLVLAAGAVAAAAVHPADQRTVTTLSNSSGADLVFDAGADGGDGTVQVGAAIVVYAVGLATHRQRVAEVGTALVEAQTLNAAITGTTKVIADRTRPDGGMHSFPSGHSSATFATADVLMQQFGRKVGIPAYAGAAYVAISRLSEKQHFLSDVVFGAAVGIASARAVVMHTSGRSVVVSPAALPGGGAVFVSVSAR
jgi:membrane-associated phospholipid phosphatase